MTLFGSLTSGVTGLTAQSRSMSMIADNVANVNTTAYKGAAPQFSNLVTRASSSLTYRPGGAQAATSYDIDRQGTIEASDRPTDAAISGNGFFVVNTAEAGGAAGEQLYTRDGAFVTDEVGNMRINSGAFLQGWALDANENVIDVNNVETVNTRQITGVGTATTELEIGANLDADQAPVAGYAVGDMALNLATNGAGGAQPQLARQARVFDSLGRPHNVTFAFAKDAAANTWNIEVVADIAEIEVATHPNGLLVSGQISFDGTGALLTDGFTAQNPITIDWLDAEGADDSTISIDFGTIGSTDGMTQFASDNSVNFVNQNGAEVGQLSGVSIDNEGYVVAAFTNGTARRIYRLPVATFANPLGLDPRTGNMFQQTDASGTFNLFPSGASGAGTINPSRLEGSNVDLADEFTRMIVTQRAYSANARVVTTTDQMLDELISLRR